MTHEFAELPVLSISLPAWVSRVLGSPCIYTTLEAQMRLAITLARENVLHSSGGPFGAAVFEQGSGRLVSVGVNSVERLHNAILHAEVMALMFAEAHIQSYTLRIAEQPSYTLVTSCDPCAMCLGAVLWSGVQRLVCGAGRSDALQLGFEEGPVFPASYHYLHDRGIEVVHGMLAHEARAVMALYQERGERIYNG